MDVTGQIRQLELAGFVGDELDHAVALAGSRRLVYTALLQEIRRGAPPEEALRLVEGALLVRPAE